MDGGGGDGDDQQLPAVRHVVEAVATRQGVRLVQSQQLLDARMDQYRLQLRRPHLPGVGEVLVLLHQPLDPLALLVGQLQPQADFRRPCAGRRARGGRRCSAPRVRPTMRGLPTSCSRAAKASGNDALPPEPVKHAPGRGPTGRRSAPTAAPAAAPSSATVRAGSVDQPQVVHESARPAPDADRPAACATRPRCARR